MSEGLPVVYLARHGETAWSLSGQHTGLKDLPLTERGERNARRLGERLKELSLKKVFTSPLQRARRTCELSGFGAEAEVERDLVRMELRRIRGTTPGPNPCGPPGLGVVPRRLSRRRITASGRNSC